MPYKFEQREPIPWSSDACSFPTRHLREVLGLSQGPALRHGYQLSHRHPWLQQSLRALQRLRDCRCVPSARQTVCSSRNSYRESLPAVAPEASSVLQEASLSKT